jgi:hypothetical protein
MRIFRAGEGFIASKPCIYCTLGWFLDVEDRRGN